VERVIRRLASISPYNGKDGGRVVVERVGGKSFRMCYNDTLKAIKDNMLDDLIRSRFGQNTGRVYSTLRRDGGLLDSATVSSIAMIPEKETRESLNVLMGHGFVVWHDLPISKQFNYNTTVSVWGIDECRVNIAVKGMLCTLSNSFRERRRVYMNSDKAGVFERLKSKVKQDYNGASNNKDGNNNSEADKIEEKECIKNLDILDQIALDLDGDMLFWCEESIFARTFDMLGYGGEYFGEVPVTFK
jgi:hypothetical protein